MEDLTTEGQRRRAIAWATALAVNTSLEAQAYEQGLLERYARGELTLNQVLEQLDTRVQHVLYRSQAVSPFSADQLADLLEESRAWNEVHAITGLLCYGQGEFIQLIEGEAQHVHRLYARIQRDPRHEHVTLLSDAAGPLRLFPDWRMAFAPVASPEFYWLLSHLEGRQHRLLVPRIPITEPHLLTLLHAFQQRATPMGR